MNVIKYLRGCSKMSTHKTRHISYLLTFLSHKVTQIITPSHFNVTVAILLIMDNMKMVKSIDLRSSSGLVLNDIDTSQINKWKITFLLKKVSNGLSEFSYHQNMKYLTSNYISSRNYTNFPLYWS